MLLQRFYFLGMRWVKLLNFYGYIGYIYGSEGWGWRYVWDAWRKSNLEQL